MKTWIRRSVYGAALLAGVAGAAVLAGTVLAEQRMQRTIELPVQPIALRDDDAAVARGRYLYASRGCADCHGPDGAGRSFVHDGGLHLAGPNISPGPGNVVANYRPVDWVRTLRHGVKPDGRPVRVMPSEDYNRLTDDDVAAVVAFVRHLPPVAGGPAVLELPLMVKALYGFGALPDAVEKIDHSQPPAQPVPEGVNLEHGRYVAQSCIGCHGPTLAGGRIPGGPPDWPAAARLLPGEGSAMVRYPTPEALQQMFRSGRRPDGSSLRVMPFQALGQLNDVDTRALYLYLRALPPA
jgi:mono/diheme cytochrome c family protein